MMLWTNSNKVPKLLKIDLKIAKLAKIWLNFFDSVLFVAMATRHMILQSVLFFNHAIQELNYKYDVMN